MLNFIISHKTELLTGALFLSESLALIPALKSNSILTLFVNVIKSLLPKSEPKV